MDKKVNKITFKSRIHMLSWKLLAIFHDPIHDFGLNTGRMSSIVKYIQQVREQLKQHKTDVILLTFLSILDYAAMFIIYTIIYKFIINNYSICFIFYDIFIIV